MLITMRQSLAFILLSLAAKALPAWADNCPSGSGSQIPCLYSGFTNFPGVSSLCKGILERTVTVTVPVTTVSTITVVISEWRGTFFDTITLSPTTLSSCTQTSTGLYLTTQSRVVSATVAINTPSATNTPIVGRHMPKQRDTGCTPVIEGIVSACSCFYGPAATLTTTVPSIITSYAAVSTVTTFPFSPLIKDVAPTCQSPPVYGSAQYATCGSPGIFEGTFESCALPPSRTNSNISHGIVVNPFNFVESDCCTACANTLDCFQALTDPSNNTCILNIRTSQDDKNHNKTPDCPLDHTFASFGDQREGNYDTGFIPGHCAQLSC